MYSLDEQLSINLDNNSKIGTFVYNSEWLLAKVVFTHNLY